MTTDCDGSLIPDNGSIQNSQRFSADGGDYSTDAASPRGAVLRT
jgi:hypothetical protein